METKKEAFKKFVIEQLIDFDYWGEASPEGYAETIVDKAVKLFCQPAVSKSFTAEEVVNELEDCDTLDDGIMFFKEQM